MPEVMLIKSPAGIDEYLSTEEIYSYIWNVQAILQFDRMEFALIVAGTYIEYYCANTLNFGSAPDGQDRAIIALFEVTKAVFIYVI